jgi:hypothetical protein
MIGVHVFRPDGGVSSDEAFLVDAITLIQGGGEESPSSTEC